MDNAVYVVFGSTGEYSDRTEWPVKAFYSKTNAETLVAAATALDYTGTSYYVVEVPLADDLFIAQVQQARRDLQ